MGILLLEESKERAREIEAWARQSANWYTPGVSVFIPGDDQRFVLQSGTYRAVFSWTVDQDGAVFRQLSVSSRSKLPAPTVVWTLCHYFGFENAELDETGVAVNQPHNTWQAAISENEGCIVVIQEVLDKRPRCKYCKEPVEKEGQVHAGGCGNVG